MLLCLLNKPWRAYLIWLWRSWWAGCRTRGTGVPWTWLGDAKTLELWDHCFILQQENVSHTWLRGTKCSWTPCSVLLPCPREDFLLLGSPVWLWQLTMAVDNGRSVSPPPSHPSPQALPCGLRIVILLNADPVPYIGLEAFSVISSLPYESGVRDLLACLSSFPLPLDKTIDLIKDNPYYLNLYNKNLFFLWLKR